MSAVRLERAVNGLMRLSVPADDMRLLAAGGAALLVLAGVGEAVTVLWPMRLALGLIYVLYAPGYCLAAALFPRRDDLSGTERIGMSMGLSVALVPVLALLLDRLPWGLTLAPILCAELAVCLVCGAVALWRRSRIPAGEAYAPSLPARPAAAWRGLPPGDRRAYLAILAALLLAALAAAAVFVGEPQGEHSSEFYMLGPEGIAENFPRSAAVGEDVTVLVGVANREGGERRYRVEVQLVDRFGDEHSALLYDGEPFAIGVGEAREWPISWQMPWAGPDQQVDILLFADSEGSPSRRLRLWLDITETR